MLYRETGQFKTSYGADHAILPIRQDQIGLAVILALAFVVGAAGRRATTGSARSCCRS